MNHIPQGASDHAAIAAAEEKRQNEQRLQSCSKPHRFAREVLRQDPPARADEPRIVDYRTPAGPPRPQVAPTSMMRCSKCYGRVTAEQAEWYARGLQHGRDEIPPSRRGPVPLAFDDGFDGRKGIV